MMSMSMNERIDDERKTKVVRYFGRTYVRPLDIRNPRASETICLRPSGVKSPGASGTGMCKTTR
jgi:hypothetical protein